jgi:nitrite reductase/ring-hydroxylating ferredoxin subunit
MRRQVDLPVAELAVAGEGRFVRVMLPVPAWMPNGALVTSILVGRVEGSVRAFANVCRHHPLPLDYDAPRPVDAPPDEGRPIVLARVMSEDAHHLVCHEHGALYRPTDGLCIDGPCRGERLFAAGVEEHADTLTVFLDG